MAQRSPKRGSFSPKFLAVCFGNRDGRGTFGLWDLLTGRFTQRFGLAGELYALSTERRIVASAGPADLGGSAGDVCITDVNTGAVLGAWRTEGDRITRLKFSPDGSALAVAAGSDIRVRDTRSGEVKLTVGGRKRVRAVAFSSDGGLLAAACSDGIGIDLSAVYVWDARSGVLVHSFKGHDDYLHSIAFSPDGRTLASSGRFQEAFLWDIELKKLIRRLPRAGDLYESLAFSPGGRLLACGTGGKSQAITLWRSGSGKLAYLLKNHDIQIPFAPE
ncbi:MAG: hypothetical protein JSU94_20615 [Phycisphaerales bacterium]|nr:MAG: hypothetical protein JSU94_20615 [Phycisphaerales bacterium]